MGYTLRCHQTWLTGKFPSNIEIYSWENHRSKWWIFQQATFNYRRLLKKGHLKETMNHPSNEKDSNSKCRSFILFLRSVHYQHVQSWTLSAFWCAISPIQTEVWGWSNKTSSTNSECPFSLAQLCNPAKGSKVPGLFRFFGACIFVSPVPGPRDWNPSNSLLGK